MKKIIILASLILFLLVGIVYSQEQSPPTTKRQMQAGELNPKPSARSNIKSTSNNNISQNVTSPINKNDSQSSNSASQNVNKKNIDGEPIAAKDDPITRYTFWLMIFTGLLVVCNVLLWLYTKKAADAAKKSADALSTVERAYVFIKHISNPKIIVDDRREINITVANIGKTPAIIKQLKGGCFFTDRYPTRHGKIENEFPDGGSVIGASDTLDIKINVQFTDEKIKEFNEGKLKLICCGLIVYGDIWKDKHETGFCWEYNLFEYDAGFALVNKNPLNYYT
jgi:hypothetical protein